MNDLLKKFNGSSGLLPVHADEWGSAGIETSELYGKGGGFVVKDARPIFL